MQEIQVWSLGWEDPLEKEMATHSSSLAWRIPWRREPVRLQSMGSQESEMTYWLNHYKYTQIYYIFYVFITLKKSLKLSDLFQSLLVATPISTQLSSWDVHSVSPLGSLSPLPMIDSLFPTQMVFSTTVRKTTCKTGLIIILNKKIISSL